MFSRDDDMAWRASPFVCLCGGLNLFSFFFFFSLHLEIHLLILPIDWQKIKVLLFLIIYILLILYFKIIGELLKELHFFFDFFRYWIKCTN